MHLVCPKNVTSYGDTGFGFLCARVEFVWQTGNMVSSNGLPVYLSSLLILFCLCHIYIAIEVGNAF
jgi:hypothetical protein